MTSFEIVDPATARAARGVRIVFASALPSPWSEAAKALFLLADVPTKWVRFRGNDPELASWTRVDNAPVVFHDDDPPRSAWADILALAARLGGERVIPDRDRARTFGLVSEIAGEDGLAWSARLLMIDASMRSDGTRGFPLTVARYLAPKYGWRDGCAEPARARIAEVLARFERELSEREYLHGDRPGAADAYLATTLTLMLADLPAECPAMRPVLIPATTSLREDLGTTVPAALIAHRARMFTRHLPSPIPL